MSIYLLGISWSIIIVGSVRRLVETCICALKEHFKSLDEIIDLLPFKLQTHIIEHNEYTPPSNHHPVVIYPLENNFL